MLVKVKRKTITYEDGSVDVLFDTKIMGLIEYSYQFTSMCDFQYLPMERTASGSYKSIVDDVIPADPFDPDGHQQEFNANAPLRILPTTFTRFDMPVDYYFKNGANYKHPDTIEARDRRVKDSQIGRIRRSRAAAAVTVTWSMLSGQPVPADVRPDALEAYEKEVLDKNLLQRVQQLFDEHPIYTRNKLLYLLECSSSELRFVLPLVAYSITDGPFRKSWSRLGFNPRTESSSLKYQVMDFRVKRQTIRAKRSVYQYQLPLQRGEESNPRSKRFLPATVINESLLLDSVLKEKQLKDEQRKQDRQIELRNQFMFSPGQMPSIRQLLCQLLDIDLDLVREMIANGSDRSEPDERDGWLPPGSIEKIRTEMSRVLEETIASNQGIDASAAAAAGDHDDDDPMSSSQPQPDDSDSDYEMDESEIESLTLR
jgi:general transcription factor 3C polypeptide 5 (transcription factor C subunit 1)